MRLYINVQVYDAEKAAVQNMVRVHVAKSKQDLDA